LRAAVYVKSYGTCLASFRLDDVDQTFFGLFIIKYAEALFVYGWEKIICLHEGMFDGYFFFRQELFNYSFSLFSYRWFRVLTAAEFALAANVETAILLNSARQSFSLLNRF
jgi:hypothetical protein